MSVVWNVPIKGLESATINSIESNFLEYIGILFILFVQRIVIKVTIVIIINFIG